MADPAAAPEALEALGRAGRGRLAPAEGGLRAVQQAVLRSFAATGKPPAAKPPAAVLMAAAAPFGAAPGDVIAELAREDFLVQDEAGQIRAAYPFSAAPTRHRVRIGGQVEVYAMCAIDALGIPPMVAADAVISSTEPDTGAPVTVTFADGHAGWEPSGAVVFIARRGDGPAVKVACSYMNFFRTPATARAWARAHPGLTGRMLSQAQAERLGRDIFGSLLTSPG